MRAGCRAQSCAILHDFACHIQHNSHLLTRFAEPVKPKPCGTVQANTDLYGADLHTCPDQGIDCAFPGTASLDACCQLCRVKAGCGSYTFQTSGGMCYLKQSTGFTASERDGYASAVIPVVAGVQFAERTYNTSWRRTGRWLSACAIAGWHNAYLCTADLCITSTGCTSCLACLIYSLTLTRCNRLQWSGRSRVHHHRHRRLLHWAGPDLRNPKRRQHRHLHEASHPCGFAHLWSHDNYCWRRGHRSCQAGHNPPGRHQRRR